MNCLHKSFKLNLENADVELHLISFDDRMFVSVFGTPEDQDMMYFWIQLIGCDPESKSYYYTLEFHGVDQNIKNTFTGQVLAIDETRKSIKRSSNKQFQQHHHDIVKQSDDPSPK